MAQGIDDYDYTSAKIRLDMIRSKQKVAEDEQAPVANQLQSENETVSIESPPKDAASQAQEKTQDKDRKKKATMSISNISKGEFMSLVKLETESNDPQLHKDGYRCSDKGFFGLHRRRVLGRIEMVYQTQAVPSRGNDTRGCSGVYQEEQFGA